MSRERMVGEPLWKENLRISPIACYKKKPRMGILIATYSPHMGYLGEGCLGGWPDSHMAIPWKLLQPNPVSL